MLRVCSCWAGGRGVRPLLTAFSAGAGSTGAGLPPGSAGGPGWSAVCGGRLAKLGIMRGSPCPAAPAGPEGPPPARRACLLNRVSPQRRNPGDWESERPSAWSPIRAHSLVALHWGGCMGRVQSGWGPQGAGGIQGFLLSSTGAVEVAHGAWFGAFLGSRPPQRPPWLPGPLLAFSARAPVVDAEMRPWRRPARAPAPLQRLLYRLAARGQAALFRAIYYAQPARHPIPPPACSVVVEGPAPGRPPRGGGALGEARHPAVGRRTDRACFTGCCALAAHTWLWRNAPQLYEQLAKQRSSGWPLAVLACASLRTHAPTPQPPTPGRACQRRTTADRSARECMSVLPPRAAALAPGACHRSALIASCPGRRGGRPPWTGSAGGEGGTSNRRDEGAASRVPQAPACAAAPVWRRPGCAPAHPPTHQITHSPRSP